MTVGYFKTTGETRGSDFLIELEMEMVDGDLDEPPESLPAAEQLDASHPKLRTLEREILLQVPELQELLEPAREHDPIRS